MRESHDFNSTSWVARAVGIIAAGSLLSGCVSTGKFQSVVAERDLLVSVKQQLTGQVEGLVAQTVALEAHNEAALNTTSSLEGRVDQLQSELSEYEKINGMLDAQRIDLAQLIQQRNADLSRLRGTYDDLLLDFAAEIEAGQVHVEALAVGIRVSLSDQVLFDTGSAELSEDGQTVIERVAVRVAEVPDRVVVEGHTDDRPIHGLLASRYPTNWELAAARATRVARILAENGTHPERIAATSFGEFHPVASNASDEERARNRRIEIRLLPATIDERIATAQPVTEEEPSAQEEPAEIEPSEATESPESWEGVEQKSTPEAAEPTATKTGEETSVESAAADAPAVAPVSSEPPPAKAAPRDNEELDLVQETEQAAE